MQTFNIPTDYNTFSHELRIPLTGILGMAGLLMDEEGLSAQQKEEITLIYQSGKRLHAFVEEMLTPAAQNVRDLLWKSSKSRNTFTI